MGDGHINPSDIPARRELADPLQRADLERQAIKDGDCLYRVVDERGRPIYLGAGVTKAEAERLARGLETPCAVVEVEATK